MEKSEIIEYIEKKRKISNKFTKPPKEFVDSLKRHTSHLKICDRTPVTAQLIWHFEYNKDTPSCQECGVKNVKWNEAKRNYRSFCSPKCANNNKHKKEKIKKTQEENGGHPSIRPEVQKRSKETNMVRYGTPYILKNKSIRAKAIKTNLERYGFPSYTQTPKARKEKSEWLKDNPDHMKLMHQKSKEYKQTEEYKNNYRDTCIKRLNINVKNESEFKNYLKKQHIENKKTATEISQEIGMHISSVCKWLGKMDVDRKYYYTSTEQNEVYDFLKEYDVDLRSNVRDVISGIELDIYAPDKKIAIEYCGLYWHSEIHKHTTYHREKYLKCKEQGIKLITIFQDEWLHKKNIVKKMLLAKLGLLSDTKLYARNTYCKGVLDYKNVENFLERNHIQGRSSGSFYIGLFDDSNELVAIGVFRKKSECEYELTRYATSTLVIGGFSKILKGLERKIEKGKSVIISTFADLRYSEGNLYQKTGFNLVKELKPDYSFAKRDIRMHKFNMRELVRENSKELENDNYSINKIASILGYYKIYDCGKQKYTKTITGRK